MKNRTKGLAAGVAFVGVTILTTGSILKSQDDLGTAIRNEAIDLTNGGSLDKKFYDLGTAATSAAAISETLDSMGANFSDARAATEAACVVAAINGGVVTEGLTSYSRGVTANDPAEFALGQRQCENVAAALMLDVYEYPDALA